MPVHDLGYRAWLGRRMPRILRPLVVAQSGIALVWRRKWLRMMIMFSWMPILIFGLGIFMFEYSSTDPDAQRAIEQLLLRRFDNPELANAALMNHDAARHDVWATLIMTFFRVPQLLAMVLLVGIIAPMLISYDLRSKAYLMYFSRPLSPLEYIIGKSAVLWFFLCMITAVPALALYVAGVFLSPDLSVIWETWDIPLRILGATMVLIIPTTALALCYSSFTSESRYATFSWFATWLMGSIAYAFLTGGGQRGFRPPRRGPRFRGREWEDAVANFSADSIDFDKWRFLSPYHTLGKVEAWVFGLDTTPASVWPAVYLLVAITVVCLFVIRHRIVARLRV